MELQINQKFAREYDKRKRREELSNLREVERQLNERRDVDQRPARARNQAPSPSGASSLHSSSSDVDESTEEDDLGLLLTKRLDAQWAQTLELIRRRDARIYDPNYRFYDDSGSISGRSESSPGTTTNDEAEPVAGYDLLALQAEKEKAVCLDQYWREGLLREAEADSSSSMSSSQLSSNSSQVGQRDRTVTPDMETVERRPRIPVYDEQQEALRVEFLERAARETMKPDGVANYHERSVSEELNEESSEDFFIVKQTDRRLEEILQTHVSGVSALAPGTTTDARRVDATPQSDEERQHAYLEKETVAEKDAFLYDYVVNNRWLGPTHDLLQRVASVENLRNPQTSDTLEEDEQFLERQDQFEQAHNFRFEEPHGDLIPSHPRRIEGSLRKPSAKQEARRRQREAKAAREDLMKRKQLETLRRLRNVHLAERTERLQRIARAAGLEQSAKAASSGGRASSEMELVERVLALAESDHDFDATKFDTAMRDLFEREAYQSAPDEGWQPDADFGIGKSASGPADSSAARSDRVTGSHRMNGHPSEIATPFDNDSDVDQFNREDLLANTRFRYRRVEPRSFGVSPEEMLDMDERELNAYASIKYIQPFRPIETLPKRLRKLHRGNTSMQRYRLRQVQQRGRFRKTADRAMR